MVVQTDILLFVLIFLISEWSGYANVVRINQGYLEGTTMVSRNGTIFNAYFGIPFAKPPVGSLRFKPPVRAKPWEGVLNATTPGAQCIQVSEKTSDGIGSEDCLHLNIYTPKDAKTGDEIPVIVYIFGGIFKQKSNTANGPQYMLDKRIIIVIPNYRLGVLGFMSTGDTVISGNMAMKDQVLAIKWVRENIRSFGGNPNQITLQGHSSGAMCVHLHTLSPMSVGLFQRVIIQSGVGNGLVGFYDREVSRSVGIELAQRIGCNQKTSRGILDCLLKIDARVFPEVQEQMYIWDLDPDSIFRPTVEVEDADSPFLTVVPPMSPHPSSNYEWLIGTTTGEGAFKAAGLLVGDGKLARQLDAQYKYLFPISLQYLWTSDLRYENQISEAIRQHYFGNASIDNATAIPLMDMYTDGTFSFATNEAIYKFEGIRYVYLYDYWSNFSTQNKRGTYPRIGWSNFAKFVTVEQGTLRGTTKVSQNGTVFNAYFGIPYARPPIGKLRFQPPLKAQPWNGTFNATSAGAKCIQIGTGSEPIVGVEDCLNINVFTPRDAEPGDNIPVIVLIFGGTFKQRSNLEDGPLFFMDRRVIIVIPNYRLGVLGFMSTGDAVISGNMGLKDQVMALRWVRDNIRAFGGDPNRVTLQGHSSGSMCVHLHTFSPLSVGLFRRIIIQSGTGNSPSGFFDRDVATSVGLELAQHLGCDRNTSKEILDCFLTLSAEQFSQAQEKLYLWQNEPNAAFRPTVEVVDAKSPFLTVAPPNARHPTTDYEWLIGTSSGECAYKAAGYLSGKGEAAKELDKDYKELFPISMQYLWTVNLQYVNQISSTIRHHFFGEDRINDTTAIPLMNMYTEELFTQPTYEAIKKFTGTKYVYLFDYYSNVSLQNTNGVYQRRLGVSHGEELHLLYWHSTSVNRLTNRDLAVGSELVTRWLNFAYSGNPNIPFSINERMFSAWKPADPTSSRIRYLRIAINGTMEKDYGEKSNRFWKNIPIMGKFF